jgi:hypothetical protein
MTRTITINSKTKTKKDEDFDEVIKKENSCHFPSCKCKNGMYLIHCIWCREQYCAEHQFILYVLYFFF